MSDIPDHIARAEGQTVHCNHAAFFALGGIPADMLGRFKLGLALGAGAVVGASMVLTLAMGVQALLKAMFA